MMHLLADKDIIIAHINHNLRASESDSDENFVIAQAKKLGLKIFTESSNVKAYAQRKKLSIETAARTIRLKALILIAKKNNCTAIATAHHKNDNAETLIHRLARGTGYRGLCGINPTRHIDGFKFISPLLDLTKADILKYLEQNNIPSIYDISNDSLEFTRNKIRKLILPRLQKQSEHNLPDLLSNLSKSSRRLCEKIKTITNSVKKPYDITVFNAQPKPIKIELIRKMIIAAGIGERNITQTHYNQIIEIAAKSKGQISLPQQYYCQAYKGFITIYKDQILQTQISIDKPTSFGNFTIETKLLDINTCDIENFKTQKDRLVEWFDYDKITLTLTARQPQRGDKFIAIGKKTERKVGDFLTSPNNFIIRDHQKIIWVVPNRPCDYTKLTNRTKKVLQVKVTEHI